LGTGKEQKIVIKSDSGLTSSEVDRMTKEAEEHAEDDHAKRELAEARNRSDQLIYSTEKTLKEHGGGLGPQERRNIEEAVKDLREALKGDDKKIIEQKAETLTQAAFQLGEMIYRKTRAQQEQAAGEEPKEGKSSKKPDDEDGEDVVDADFKVKD